MKEGSATLWHYQLKVDKGEENSLYNEDLGVR